MKNYSCNVILVMLFLFFSNYLLSQCQTDASYVPYPGGCNWDLTTCTDCCTSSSGGTCQFYFYCGDPSTGHECDILMVCHGDIAKGSIRVTVQSWDETYDGISGAPNSYYTNLGIATDSLGRAKFIFGEDLSGNTNYGIPANVTFIIYPGTAYAETASFNFNCQ